MAFWCTRDLVDFTTAFLVYISQPQLNIIFKSNHKCDICRFIFELVEMHLCTRSCTPARGVSEEMLCTWFVDFATDAAATPDSYPLHHSQGRTCSPWWCKTHYRAESFSDIYWLSKSKHLLLISVNAAWPPPSLPGDLCMEVKEDQHASDDPQWESTKSLSLKQTVFLLKCAVHEYFYFDNISY